MLFNMGSADAAPVIEKAVADKFIMALQAVDNGPLTTCQDEALAEMVETSSNVASVMTDENSINIVASQRSNVMSNLDNMTNTVKAAFLLAGAEVNVGGKYPAWKMRASSKLTDITVKSYEKLFWGKEPLVKGIHAGLECGLFSERYPDLRYGKFRSYPSQCSHTRGSTSDTYRSDGMGSPAGYPPQREVRRTE